MAKALPGVKQIGEGVLTAGGFLVSGTDPNGMV